MRCVEVLNQEETAGVRYIPELGKNMEVTFNYIKHSSNHLFRRWMINTFYRRMIEGLSGLEVYTILDAGCGEGFTLDRLSKAKIGGSLIGADRSRTALNLGKELFPSLNLAQADIYNLPFKDNSLDLIVCTEVLEHVKNPRMALRELLRVSKKYLVLSVPNEPLFSLKNLAIGRNITRLGNTEGHVNLWTAWGFHSFIKQEEVKVIESRHPFPFTLLFLEKVTDQQN